MIYAKSMRMSDSTSKYEESEIRSLMDHHSGRITDMSNQLNEVICVPLKLVWTLVMMYYYFSWTMYAPLLTVGIFTLGNYFMAKYNHWRGELGHKNAKEKGKTIHESINSIKIIKLNSYVSIFLDRIYETRRKEMPDRYINMLLEFVSDAFYRLIHPSLMLAAYGAFVYHGFTISIAHAVAAGWTLGNLHHPLHWLPHVMNSYADLKFSMTKI